MLPSTVVTTQAAAVHSQFNLRPPKHLVRCSKWKDSSPWDRPIIPPLISIPGVSMWCSRRELTAWSEVRAPDTRLFRLIFRQDNHSGSTGGGHSHRGDFDCISPYGDVSEMNLISQNFVFRSLMGSLVFGRIRKNAMVNDIIATLDRLHASGCSTYLQLSDGSTSFLRIKYSSMTLRCYD